MSQGGRRRTRTNRPHAASFVVVVAALVTVAVACGSGGGGAALRRPPALDDVASVPAEPPRVLIFGDSIAAQHGGPAAVALREVGVEAEVFALWGEGLFSTDQYDMGAPVPDPPPATLMHEASAHVAEFRPDAVAVYANHNYWPPYPRDAAGATIEPGTEAFAAMARAQLTELVRRLSAGGASIHLVSPVPERPGDTAAANPIWAAYLSMQDELGFSVIDAGAVVAAPDGTRAEEVPDCRGAPARVRPPGDLHVTYYGAGLMATTTAAALAEAVGVDPVGLGAPADAPAALVPFGAGYRIVTCDGAGFRFAAGGSPLLGLGAGGRRAPDDPVVGAAAARGDGAWLVTAAGVVAALDGAPELGDVAVPAGDRVTAIAATPSGRGFWALTAGGTVVPAGDAVAAGDLAGELAHGEVAVAIVAASVPAAPPGPTRAGDAASADGDDGGYRVATSRGRVAGFGGATVAGDLAAPPAGGVVAMASQPGGDGYWLLDRTGRPYAFGGAPDLGSAADQPLVQLARFASTHDFDTVAVPPAHAPTEAVALLPTRTGRGYWVQLANGAVCSFGDAHPWGGIHRAEVDEIMIYKHQPYYAEGPCRQDVGFGPPNTSPAA